jgi:membrane associated rhomboid family serine protease
MIPLRDINPTRRFPIITITLIIVNVLIFVYEMTLSDRALYDLIMTAGVIPYQVSHSLGPAVARDMFTSMFLHGGWMHLLSNMLYLWIFGNNIEDVLGPFRFTFFYLVCGILATLAQVLAGPNANVPTIGASGAIAGVLGAYLMLYPQTRVLSIVFVLYFIRFVEVPAIIVLGLWFILQFLNGLTSLNTAPTGGVAYFAHIGGFVAGAALIFILGARRRSPPPPRSRYPRNNLFRDQFPDLWE